MKFLKIKNHGQMYLDSLDELEVETFEFDDVLAEKVKEIVYNEYYNTPYGNKFAAVKLIYENLELSLYNACVLTEYYWSKFN